MTTKRCDTCGKTEEEWKENYNREVKVIDRGNLNICENCNREYNAGKGKSSEPEDEEEVSKNWKDEVTA